ncbi:MAG: leucine-rich repeat protein [Clostridia bacterium]|nr:leucine-rich repeat protein [Clostridia bacterium]
MKKKSVLVLIFSMLLSVSAFAACSKEPKAKAKEFVVAFSTNEGTAVESVLLKEGEQLDLSELITEREGKYFVGWYTDEALTIPASNIVTPTSNVTLYAKWADLNVTYTLSFDSQGGSAVAAQTYDPNAYLVAPEAPTRENYIFDGWYYDQECTKEFFFTGFIMPNKNTTVYAKWNEVFEIGFETNGGSAVEPYVGIPGDEVEAPADPIRENYIFDGWFADEACTEAYEFSVIPEESITVYAKWHEKKTGISVKLIGNLPDVTATLQKTYTYDEGDGLKVVDHEEAIGYFYSLTENTYKAKFFDQNVNLQTNPLYVFNYWTYDAAGNEPFDGTIPAEADGELELYAKWNRSAKYVEVSFDMLNVSANESYYLLKNTAVPEAKMESVQTALTSAYTPRGCAVVGFASQNGETISVGQPIVKDTVITPVVQSSGLSFTYSINLLDGSENKVAGYVLSGYTAAQKELNAGKDDLLLILPETYNDGTNGELPVVAIGAQAFKDQPITEIYFSESLFLIENQAFCGTSLTALTIPSNIQVIGNGAFSGCESLANVVWESTDIGYMGSDVFSNTPYETALIANANNGFVGVGKNGYVLYKYVGSAETVTTPVQYTVLASGAFKGTAVKTLTISDSVVHYGNQTFYQMSRLTTVTIGASFTGIFAREQGLFMDCTALQSVTFQFPKSVKVIPNRMFSGATALQRMDLSEFTSLTKISDFAFSYSGLTEISFPKATYVAALGAYVGLFSEIGQCAFTETGLTNLSLQETSLKTISHRAFEKTSLVSVLLPASLQSVGMSAFESCTKLEEVVFNGSAVVTFTYPVFSNSGYTPEGGEFTATVVYVPSALVQGYKDALSGCGVSVKSVEERPVQSV